LGDSALPHTKLPCHHLVTFGQRGSSVSLSTGFVRQSATVGFMVISFQMMQSQKKLGMTSRCQAATRSGLAFGDAPPKGCHCLRHRIPPNMNQRHCILSPHFRMKMNCSVAEKSSAALFGALSRNKIVKIWAGLWRRITKGEPWSPQSNSRKHESKTLHPESTI
jgi:hypothetical protein